MLVGVCGKLYTRVLELRGARGFLISKLTSFDKIWSPLDDKIVNCETLAISSDVF